MSLRVFLSCFLSFFFFATLSGQSSSRLSPQDYIEKYNEWAVMNMKRTGVPASITLAQGMLESGNGNSRLAVEANNHFGIKCHEWTGEKVYHHDDRRNECFRKYNSVYDSYFDHAKFLTGRSRYASLFELETTDYKGWAKGLKKAGYATDPNYAKRLIDIIEKYQLHLFDEEGGRQTAWRRSGEREISVGTHEIDPFSRHEVHYNNGVKYVKVQSSDTFSGIAEEFGLRDWELPRYNDLGAERGKVTDYKYLYIQPKRKNAHPNHKTHLVRENETMFEISQIYGVKMKSLYKINEMPEGKEPRPGDRIKLR